MSADLLALLDSDPATGVLAVADLRERRCDSVTRGEWYAEELCIRVRALGMEGHGEPWLRTPGVLMPPTRSRIPLEQLRLNVDHAAAEANPKHALAAVRRWRGVVERHKQAHGGIIAPRDDVCGGCMLDWPCPDLIETADEARAYLGGTA